MIMRTCSLLGAPVVRTLLAALMAGWLLAHRHVRQAVLVVVGVGGVGVLNTLLKVVVRRRRPHHLVLRAPARSSFPSGHASGTLTLSGVGLYLLWQSAVSRLVVIAAAVLAAPLTALVGLSRIDLGKHHATDVIAGWTLAGLWLAVVLRVGPWHERSADGSN